VLAPPAAGLVELAPEELLWPELAPGAALSFMQRSFSSPVRFAHFVSLAPAAAEPPVWAPVLLEPDALELGLSDCAEVLGAFGAPALPGDVWAKEALDSASSAAAVALTRTFRFIWLLL
jgi:hypothetical protein